MQSADVIEYAQNLEVSRHNELAKVVFERVRGELTRELYEREGAVRATLAGYTLGLMTAMILMAPLRPQQFSPQKLTATVFTDS